MLLDFLDEEGALPEAAPEAPSEEHALNPPQADAVTQTRGPVLVFAGAGSGKTRVITYRIANLVATERVAPYRILAVTFTNKAAGEMRRRLETITGVAIAKDLWVGTFHATCAKLLRRYGEAIGLPKSFVIYDTQDQRAVISRVLKDLDFDEKRYPPRSLLQKIHAQKQEGRGPDDMPIESYLDEAAAKVFRKYEAYLEAAAAVDFEDLIGKAVRLAEDDALPEAAQLRRKFEYVLVDEFQDTNAMQYRLLRALTKESRNLCVVGDDDQSIYKWRGADVRNIRGFKKDFPDAHVIKLEQNYRSTARIVKAALGVIAPSREREPKDLWTANEDGEPVCVAACRDEHDEAALVVRAIVEAREKGTNLAEIAIFYRVHAQSRVLEDGLRLANLPYQIVGGTKFYDRAEIKDAISYLRVLVNPRSDVDLLRIINSPARGIGQTTVERVTALASRLGIPVHDALRRLEEAPDIAMAARKKLLGLAELLGDLRRLVSGDPAGVPSDVLDAVLRKTGYLEALRNENSAEADARLENLAELSGSLSDYEIEATAAGEVPSVTAYLERISLQSDVDGMKDEPRVVMMTVHGAKGLEFELVFLTGMEEDMFPYRGMSGGGDDDVEEERRLAYVAITRARHRLVLTHATFRQIFGNTRYGKPSRFIGDIPSDCRVHRTTAGARATGPTERFIDRPSFLPPSSRRAAPARRYDEDGPPSNVPPSIPGRAPLNPGERFVDREFFADDPGESPALRVRRGSRVMHERFGEGEVKSLADVGEPAVVAYFPGWGDRKVLLRFLKLG